MSTEKNKEIVRTFFELGNQGNMDACVAMLGEDLVWTGIGSTCFSGTNSGKDRVLDSLIGPLFSRLKAGIHMTIDNLIAEGDTVVMEARGTAETLEGVPYNNTYCMVITVTDGKIRKVVEYCDTALIDSVFGSA